MTVSIDKTESERDILAALAAEGIESLEALASRLANLDRVQTDEALLSAVSANQAGVESKRTVRHRPPEAGLVVDGQRLDPSEISQFDGTALHSTPGLDRKREPTLFSFTTTEALMQHVVATRGADDIGTSNPDSLSELSYYYSDDSGRGDWLQNGPGRAWRDLSRVGRGIFHAGDWNDVISSVNWCRWDVSLYEHPNYGGSQLYLRAGRTYYHLAEWGFNDRASSTVNWGRRF